MREPGGVAIDGVAPVSEQEEGDDVREVLHFLGLGGTHQGREVEDVLEEQSNGLRRA